MRSSKRCQWCKKTFYVVGCREKIYCSNTCSQKAFENAAKLIEIVTTKKGLSNGEG